MRKRVQATSGSENSSTSLFITQHCSVPSTAPSEESFHFALEEDS
jgi:hypothetical protein